MAVAIGALTAITFRGIQLGATNVVSANCIPVPTKLFGVTRQNPRPNLQICARVMQGGLGDTKGFELRQPDGIYLHHSNVVAAVRVLVDRFRIEVAFGLSNGLQHVNRDAVVFACGLPTRRACCYRDRNCDPGEGGKKKVFRCVLHGLNVAGPQASIQRGNIAQKWGLDV